MAQVQPWTTDSGGVPRSRSQPHESLLLGRRTPGMPLSPPPSMAGNFPTAKDKEELRGHPRRYWDNGALCPTNQNRDSKAKGRWGLSCLRPGKSCLPGPHPEPLPSRGQGDPGQNPAWPTQGGRRWVHQADNASPSMVPLCNAPLGREGRNHLRCPLPAGQASLLGAGGGHQRPALTYRAQGGPGLTADGRLGWDPVFLDCRPSAPEAGVAGKARGTGAGTGAGEYGSLSDGAVAASHLLPALWAPGFLRDWQVCGGGVPGPQPHPLFPRLALPASAAPTPAQASLSHGGR